MSIIKVNLGCGPSGINGWVNFDWGALPLLNKTGLTPLLVSLGILGKNYLINWPKFKLWDIRRKLPMTSSSVDYVYCSHVLEHFERCEGLAITREIKRILKVGGVARIVLPDVEKMTVYYTGAKKFNEEFWGYNKEELVGIKRRFIRGHQWMYDLTEAKVMLTEAGFKKISVVSFRKGRTPDIKKLDLAGYSKISLYLEAEKS